MMSLFVKWVWVNGVHRETYTKSNAHGKGSDTNIPNHRYWCTRVSRPPPTPTHPSLSFPPPESWSCGNPGNSGSLLCPYCPWVATPHLPGAKVIVFFSQHHLVQKACLDPTQPLLPKRGSPSNPTTANTPEKAPWLEGMMLILPPINFIRGAEGRESIFPSFVSALLNKLISCRSEQLKVGRNLKGQRDGQSADVGSSPHIPASEKSSNEELVTFQVSECH